ncbi:MAG: fibronectin type III domain-containing protein [Candidatus Gracilibacteria bacterium]|nr:fibronectin type III domain-containing protein [Candidatus Gracilibacteria bacterium]
MQYTKYLATLATFSLISVSTLVSAATGDVTTTATGMTTVAPTTNSLEVQGAPRLVKKTTDSVVLEWDAVPAASAYIVKYSKTSVATSTDPNAQYDNETDQVTTTGAVITKLSSTNEQFTPETSYYFSVVAIDNQGKESDTFSDELMVTTESMDAAVISSGSTTPVVTLAINDLVVIDDRTLSLSFNSDLSTESVRVKITKTSDNSDIAVETVVQDSMNLSTVTITTLSALIPASSYTLTVLSAKDAAGNIIQEGVNGLKEFTTSETLQPAIETVPALNAAPVSEEVVSIATATEVATGAKENLIILAALLLSLGIVYIYRRKLI